MQTASAVSRWMSRIVRAWKSGMSAAARCLSVAPRLSQALEIVEWLAAGRAAPQRLAGGRAERRDFCRRRRAAARAGHGLVGKERAAGGAGARCRWGDAAGGELGAALRGDVVRAPGRRQLAHDADVGKTRVA